MSWPCDAYQHGSAEWFRCLLDQLKKVGGDDWASKINAEMSEDEKQILMEKLKGE